MTDAEKIAYVKATSDETDDSVISAFLTRAKYAVLNRLYTAWHEFPEGAEVPARYELAQCELAVRYIDRQGGEGQTGHSENGISRTWDSPDDADILRGITPIVEIPK